MKRYIKLVFVLLFILCSLTNYAINNPIKKGQYSKTDKQEIRNTNKLDYSSKQLEDSTINKNTLQKQIYQQGEIENRKYNQTDNSSQHFNQYYTNENNPRIQAEMVRYRTDLFRRMIQEELIQINNEYLTNDKDHELIELKLAKYSILKEILYEQINSNSPASGTPNKSSNQSSDNAQEYKNLLRQIDDRIRQGERQLQTSQQREIEIKREQKLENQ